MKTHELISLIEYISKIMAHYPNKSVEYALDDILNLLDARKKKPTPIVKEKQSSQILKKRRLPQVLQGYVFTSTHT
ncbi:hypothetical protein M2I81_12270 [Klebsiella pneumoniae]|uniref:Uncharacterized protein n=1 Tax=Klebsiella pneumoniae TaxID=573 RepID=A0A927HTS5_KLEPN|nr:hypothetical protein [Klebsiella pneumoniae]MDO6174787.1 hypothetical protein [Klebsiella pneumoniae]